jgi:peptide/nickel transport system substrate-binding protein
MFPDKAGLMASRELTASDVAFCIQRCYSSPGFGTNTFPTIDSADSIKATDKYIVVITTSGYDPNWETSIGTQIPIYAPEWANAGINDWNNAVGSGPFMYQDYVQGAVMNYVKNPVYWGKTTIGGKEYQEPFIDKLAYPIIADESTRMAALRTGKLDWIFPVTYFYVDSLKKSTPQLTSVKFLTPSVDRIIFNNTNKYFKDENVRRALMVGTDMATIVQSVYGEGELNSFPIMNGYPGIWTPLDQMPASTQVLFTYDPVKAKQMLADAGYANGFDVSIIVPSYSLQQQDDASLVKDEWSKLGINVTVKVVDIMVLIEAMEQTGDYDIILTSSGDSAGLSVFGTQVSKPNPPYGFARYSDPNYDQQYLKAYNATDVTQQNAILKALALYYLDQAPQIPLGAAYMYNFYWPWVKNYHGEINTGSFQQDGLLATLWIDQSMRKTMGYQ